MSRYNTCRSLGIDPRRPRVLRREAERDGSPELAPTCVPFDRGRNMNRAIDNAARARSIELARLDAIEGLRLWLGYGGAQ